MNNRVIYVDADFPHEVERVTSRLHAQFELMRVGADMRKLEWLRWMEDDRSGQYDMEWDIGSK